MKLSEKILEEKMFLAEQSLTVAKESLDDIQTLVNSGEVGIKELISVFNSAVKTHRELVADIQKLAESEEASASERTLAKNKDYKSKVDELLKGLKKDGN